MADPHGGAPRPMDAEPTPGYLRPRFVLGVVVLTALLALVIHALGTSGNVELSSEGEVVTTLPIPDPDSEVAPESTDPADCPEPGPAVELEAAELLRFFAAAVTEAGLDDLPVSAEVLDQMEATAPVPPVTRMTRVGGFVGETGTWSSCVLSSWIGPEGPLQSLDIVTASVVAAEDRSDATGGRGGSRGRSGPEEDRWEVTGWLRGTPQEPGATRAASLAFYNSERSCGRPDRFVSVPVADLQPSDRLVAVLEELISGTPGRAANASSVIPADVQVLEAEVTGDAARVVLTPTVDEDLTRCEGTAAYEQIHDTAAALVTESLPPPPEGPEPANVEVAVVVDGQEVETLRP